MRLGFPIHLALFLLVNAGLFVLNLAPVDFDFDRPGVPLWFTYPLVGWSPLLIAHLVLVARGLEIRRRDAPRAVVGPAPEPEVVLPAVDPAQAGRAGTLLAECRLRSGRVLAALGAVGGVPLDVDDLLRGAIAQAEHLAERLAPVYRTLAQGDDPAARARKAALEERLEALHVALEILRLEAVVIEEESSRDLRPLAGPLEQLREAILAAGELLVTQS